MVVHQDCFHDFDTVLFLVFRPEVNKKFFNFGWLEKKLSIVTPKEDMGVRLFRIDVALGHQYIEDPEGKV